MTIEAAILEQLHDLSPEQRQEVLDFARFLSQRYRNPAPKPRKSAKGVLNGLAPSVTEEDIAEARREMWGRFSQDGSATGDGGSDVRSEPGI